MLRKCIVVLLFSCFFLFAHSQNVDCNNIHDAVLSYFKDSLKLLNPETPNSAMKEIMIVEKGRGNDLYMNLIFNVVTAADRKRMQDDGIRLAMLIDKAIARYCPKVQRIVFYVGTPETKQEDKLVLTYHLLPGDRISFCCDSNQQPQTIQY